MKFEDYLDFLENDLGCKLFDYQKELLRKTYEDKRLYYCTNRYSDTHWLYNIMRKLKEEMNRDSGGWLPWTYKPDGYSTAVVMCDENWGEDIEWEKET